TAWMSTSMPSHCARTCSKQLSTSASFVRSHRSVSSALTLSARGRTRFSSASPAYVKMKLAPCSCMARAMPQAMLRSLATPKTRTRLPSNRRVGVMSGSPSAQWAWSFENVECAGEVLLREDTERDERRRALEPFDERQLLG